MSAGGTRALGAGALRRPNGFGRFGAAWLAAAAALALGGATCPPRAEPPSPATGAADDAGAPGAGLDGIEPEAPSDAGPEDGGSLRKPNSFALSGDAPDAAAFAVPPAPPPDDPIGKLYSHQLDFSQGAPQVRVRLMEGQTWVRFAPRGRMRLVAHGGLGKVLDAPEGTEWVVAVTQSEPAEIAWRVQAAEHRFQDKEALAADRKLWADRGFATSVQILGAAYGIAGRVVDTRKYVLFIGEPGPQEGAREALKDLHRRFGFQGVLFQEPVHRPHAILEIRDATGTPLAVAQDLVAARTPAGEGFLVRDVEHDPGYAWHGREDRLYPGELYVVADAAGKLAVVNVLPLETYVRGVVPSEIYASAHAEALRAQAVTARGEVLAKIGQRHLSDPYLLCADQHCQVYKGERGTAPSTDAAVVKTAGEVLFGADGGGLVPSQYSAVCGGHTENNENAWARPPDPGLRGRPDLLEVKKRPVLDDAGLGRFLGEAKGAYCAVSSFAQKGKYRWEKRFTAAELDSRVADLKVGRVLAIKAAARGVSGRVTVLSLSGETGATQVRGELTIRKRFDNLNSAMFVVESVRDASGRITEWAFRGGGWGHGVGMCQVGAIGRAERGQTYSEILRHYFNGAEVVRIY